MARTHKLDRAGTALHAFSQLSQKGKYFTIPSAVTLGISVIKLQHKRLQHTATFGRT